MKHWWDGKGHYFPMEYMETKDSVDEYDQVEREKELQEELKRKFVLMTSVSMPVFEKGVNTSTLHGVCGIDVPIEEFKRLLKPHLVSLQFYNFLTK